MHSSRMRNVRCSGRLSCHACPLPCMPLPHMASSLCMPPPLPHMPPLPHTSPLPYTPPFAMHVSLVDKQTLVKHYLSATTVADCNEGDTLLERYQIITASKQTHFRPAPGNLADRVTHRICRTGAKFICFDAVMHWRFPTM